MERMETVFGNSRWGSSMEWQHIACISEFSPRNWSTTRQHSCAQDTAIAMVLNGRNSYLMVKALKAFDGATRGDNDCVESRLTSGRRQRGLSLGWFWCGDDFHWLFGRRDGLGSGVVQADLPSTARRSVELNQALGNRAFSHGQLVLLLSEELLDIEHPVEVNDSLTVLRRNQFHRFS